VFTNGRADSKGYRRFRVRLPSEEANDVAMMREVLERRFAPARLADGRFGSRPGLVIVDGGKPQLSAALAAMADIGVEDIPVVGLAKREEELWTSWGDQPVVLPAGSPSLFLVKRVRDEAHRFAIEYHRNLRGKALTASALDDIPGVGPKRKKALVKAFGSVKRLRETSVDEIVGVPGIPRDTAEEIVAALRPDSEDPTIASNAAETEHDEA
jgi:excinuclease ABC subunit C